MVDWAQLFLMELIFMRMSGFVLFNPLWGQQQVPGLVKAGFIMGLSAVAFGLWNGTAPPLPSNLVAFTAMMLLELAVGFALSFVIRLFLSVAQMGGEIIDTQMGMTMAQIYDASMQTNMTVTGSLLNILLILDFFAENGHYTLVRILTLSGELLPYGTAALGEAAASYIAEIFLSCMVLAVKLALPILAAELLGEIGMGMLMKAIPQINAFVINMELKVIIGLGLFFLFLTPINEFLLDVELQMLSRLQQLFAVLVGS